MDRWACPGPPSLGGIGRICECLFMCCSTCDGQAGPACRRPCTVTGWSGRTRMHEPCPSRSIGSTWGPVRDAFLGPSRARERALCAVHFRLACRGGLSGVFAPSDLPGRRAPGRPTSMVNRMPAWGHRHWTEVVTPSSDVWGVALARRANRTRMSASSTLDELVRSCQPACTSRVVVVAWARVGTGSG